MNNIITLAENWAREMAWDCAQAQHTITISALSLHPPRNHLTTDFGKLWQAWESAASRGVRVMFFLPAPCKAHPATGYNGSAARSAFDAGLSVRFVQATNLLHAKSAVIDGRIVWIGSGNMTAAAAHFNHEIYCRFESEEIAARIAARWDKIANPA